VSISTASSAVGSSIIYTETDLGGGQWRYDYTFFNTSTDNELNSVYFYFTSDTAFTGMSLPAGWEGIVWDGNTWTTGFADTFSTENLFDIRAGSSLGGFSFTVDYQAGNISYDAFFNGDNVIAGVTAPAAPEPLSPVLFITGGLFLAVSISLKRRKSSNGRMPSDRVYPFFEN